MTAFLDDHMRAEMNFQSIWLIKKAGMRTICAGG